MIRTSFAALFIVISASYCFGTDMEVSFRTDNLYWAPTHRDTAAGRTYQGADLFWSLEGSVTQELGDGLLFKGGIVNDPVLRTRAYTQLGFTLDNLSLNFSPFLATFNSTKWFSPGMEAMVEYTWPGLLFVRGGFLTTFAPVAKNGDYYLSSLTAGVGALLENGILSFNVVDKMATFQLPGTLTTVDGSTKYWVDLEMFLKNFPLRWAFLTGYQLTNRTYLDATEVSTPVHSVLIGARLAWDFGQGTTTYLQGESAFFQQGWDDTILKVPSSTAVFQAACGVRYHW